MKLTLDEIILKSFSNSELIRSAVKEGFGKYLNDSLSPDEGARYLAIFLHKSMIKDNPHSKHRDLIKTIKTVHFDAVVALFRLL